jgi:hypothetical protein
MFIFFEPTLDFHPRFATDPSKKDLLLARKRGVVHPTKGNSKSNSSMEEVIWLKKNLKIKAWVILEFGFEHEFKSESWLYRLGNRPTSSTQTDSYRVAGPYMRSQPHTDRPPHQPNTARRARTRDRRRRRQPTPTGTVAPPARMAEYDEPAPEAAGAGNGDARSPPAKRTDGRSPQVYLLPRSAPSVGRRLAALFTFRA